jgi:hypothetical protein
VTGTSLENLTIFGGSLFVDRLLFVTGTSAAVRDVNLYNNDATSISFRGAAARAAPAYTPSAVRVVYSRTLGSSGASWAMRLGEPRLFTPAAASATRSSKVRWTQ